MLTLWKVVEFKIYQGVSEGGEIASKLERERGNYRTRKAEKEREAHAGLEMFVNSVWHLIAFAQFYLNNVCKLVVKSP